MSKNWKQFRKHCFESTVSQVNIVCTFSGKGKIKPAKLLLKKDEKLRSKIMATPYHDLMHVTNKTVATSWKNNRH